MSKVSKPLNQFFEAPKFRVIKNNADYSTKDLLRLNFDFDVFLPTIGKNLQRPLCWDIDQKRELIWSVVKGIFIPNICVIQHENQDKSYIIQVIDGKQRLSTVLSFLKDDFTLNVEGEEFLFSELHKSVQDYILYSFHFLWNKAYSYYDDPITDQEKINWFKMINFAGTPMEREHLNNLES